MATINTENMTRLGLEAFEKGRRDGYKGRDESGEYIEGSVLHIEYKAGHLEGKIEAMTKD